jgi:hypothetical protein
MERNKTFPATGIGTVSLLMIWIILCMVIFAALSLTTASRDVNFSRTLARHTTAYYTADAQAQETLQLLDQLIADHPDQAALLSALPEDVSGELENGVLTLSYQVPMTQDQALSVVLTVRDGTCTIASWQEIQTTQWTGDNSLSLMK